MSDGEIKKDKVTVKKATLWKVAVAILAVVLVFNWMTGDDEGTSNNGEAKLAPTISAEDYIDDDPMIGDPDAPITIVEFSDFQCSFCKRFRTQTFDQLKEEYIDTGKAKLVYRDFPLHSIHPHAQKAAEAAECAEDQGMFWEYHDLLFENQGELAIDDLKLYASRSGLDTTQFNECLDSGKYASEVGKDLSDGQKAGARGTPYFIVGNTVLSGAQPFQNFKAAIDAQL